MTLEQVLGNRYSILGRMPAATPSHQRYLLRSGGSSADRYVLSYCDYARPISPAALAQQRTVAEALTRPPVALLCRVLEHRLEKDYQAVISEFPGEMSLIELLQQRQCLTMEEVEAFLRLLTEACEAAVAMHWPALYLDAHHLYLDSRLGLPRIPAPDIPSFEAVGAETSEIDPLQTMAFDAAALRQSSAPLPKDSRDYVLPLAALCSDLLGQPQMLRGGMAHFKTLPQLTPHQNGMLKRVFAGEAISAGARIFIDEFFGISTQRGGLTAHTERIRILTATVTTRRERPLAAPTLGDGKETVKCAGPPPPTHPDRIAPMTWRANFSLDALPPVERLRLMPDNEDGPVLVLVSGENLRLGRSSADADFVAQFRPRSNINDGRSRRISRLQTRVSLEGRNAVLEEIRPLNSSVLLDQPLGASTTLPLPVTILLAGEYPAELVRVESDYTGPREVRGLAVNDPIVPPRPGALVARSNTSGVLLWEAALVFRDVGLHFSASGKPWFRCDNLSSPIARFHRLENQFWLELVEPHVVRGVEESPEDSPHDLILLQPGGKLRIGHFTYTVESYVLNAEPPTSTSPIAQTTK